MNKGRPGETCWPLYALLTLAYVYCGKRVGMQEMLHYWPTVIVNISLTVLVEPKYEASHFDFATFRPVVVLST